jgi:hypothetical protein
MRKPELNLRNLSFSPTLIDQTAPAHSGVELIESLPFAEQATELVRTLLLDRVQLTQSSQMTSAGFVAPVFALNRR